MAKCAKIAVEVNPWTGRVSVWECKSKNYKWLIAELDDLRQYHRWLASEYDDGTIKFED